MPTPEEILRKQKNSIVNKWSRELVLEVKTEISRLKVTDTSKLHDSIRKRIKREYGEISAITIFYQWYGMFTIPGVGKSWPLKKVKGMNASLNPRKPRDWYNKISEARTIELADKLAAINADAYVNNLKI